MNGQALDLFGAGRHTLETQNILKLAKLITRTINSETPFYRDVYFINNLNSRKIYHIQYIFLYHIQKASITGAFSLYLYQHHIFCIYLFCFFVSVLNICSSPNIYVILVISLSNNTLE